MTSSTLVLVKHSLPAIESGVPPSQGVVVFARHPTQHCPATIPTTSAAWT